MKRLLPILLAVMPLTLLAQSAVLSPRLAGIIALEDVKLAVLEEPSSPRQPKRELLLKEGQSEGRTELVEIQSRQGTVKATVSGEVQVLGLTNQLASSARTFRGLALEDVSLQTVLLLLGRFSDRTVLQHPSLRAVSLTINHPVTHRAEAAQVLKVALEEKQIAVVTDGDKFLLVAPKAQAPALNPRSVQHATTSTNSAAAELFPAGSLNFQSALAVQVLMIYAELRGEKLDRSSPLPPTANNPIFLKMETALTKAECLYALETLLNWNGIKLVPAENGLVKAVATSSDNPPPTPILEGHTADPHAIVFDDTYYVYPTSDKSEWQTTDFSAWSSQDLIHWKNEGMILDVTKDLKWAKIRAWAPAMIRRNGTYYFYFCAEQKIGVATNNAPTGKFTDALERPLLAPSREHPGQVIDPQAFLDDDGQAYLYYGQGQLYAYKLKPDMVTLDGPPVKMTPPRFNEGIFVFKRNGLYYFMWSEHDARDARYQVAYGTAKSPLGPIELPPDNVILRQHGPAVGTGHHSVVQVPGTDRWYVIYHRHAIPDGNGYTRQTCLARMEFDAAGRIQPVDPLAAPFPPGSKGEPVARP